MNSCSNRLLVVCAGLAALVLTTSTGCVTGHCRDHREAAMKKAKEEAKAQGGEAPPAVPGLTPLPSEKLAKPFDRVRVFKYDGSLQCNMGEAIALEIMRKELGSIQVYGSKNLSDGLMRIQVCGSPTGKANVYEIDRKDLEAALKLGFKEWTYGDF